MRAIGMDPVQHTQTCFRALVDVMSRPGTVRESPTTPADHAVLATLVDHEVTCHTPDDDIRKALSNEGRFTEAPVETADIVHVLEPITVDVESLSRGSLKEPSDGATVVYRVNGLTTDVDASIAGTTVEISGPGVPGERLLSIEGFPAAEVRALAAAQSSYPRGVDAVLTTDSRLTALPRSINVEVR